MKKNCQIAFDIDVYLKATLLLLFLKVAKGLKVDSIRDSHKLFHSLKHKHLLESVLCQIEPKSRLAKMTS